MKANVKFGKCPKTNGAMVTIKWQTKDLLFYLVFLNSKE